ncbi:hypothetical protein ZIOFF_032438 [Zingiber officinale]|uniref:LOB domain-containing protein n=2 Tax=Zingiber officinale TaxID=94328 RepID=A0A8J5LAT8_ZINOF|nr:hypothetical protein ZIOFF_032438 [Zingiber officinale]
MLQQIPEEQRSEAADAIALEAFWRVQDPVYGSAGVISALQAEISGAQRELAETQARVAVYAARARSADAQVLADEERLGDGAGVYLPSNHP